MWHTPKQIAFPQVKQSRFCSFLARVINFLDSLTVGHNTHAVVDTFQLMCGKTAAQIRIEKQKITDLESWRIKTPQLPIFMFV